MVTTDASGATISTMIGNYYDHTFLERLEANLVYDKYGVQKPLPENQGDTIVWHQLLNPAAGTVLTDGVTMGASAVSARKVSATITWVADLKSVTDRVVATAVCPVVEETVQALGYGAALTLDNFISDKIGFGSVASTGLGTSVGSGALPSVYTMGFPVLEGESNTISWATTPTVGGYACAMKNGLFSTAPSIKHIRRAVTQLKKMNAMPFDDGNYRGIIGPVVSDYIRGDTNFATWMAYTNRAAMEKGQLGVIEKVLFDETSNDANVAVSAANWSGATSGGGYLRGTIIFGKGAYGVTKMGGKDAKVSVVSGPDKSDPLNQVTYIGYKIGVAAHILNPSAGVMYVYYDGT
jgi:N4-gp56 family major capsid protein